MDLGRDSVQLVRCATLAPSSHNTQPWAFAVEGDELRLYADRTRALPVNDPEDRELTISCGAALLNLRVATSALGGSLSVELLPDAHDPDLLAVARPDAGSGASGEEALGQLFDALPRRRTYRRRFADREVPSELVERLAAAAVEEGAELAVLSQAEKHVLAERVADGDRALWADRRWRRELAAWMHPRRSGDGIALPWVKAAVQPAVVRTFDLGKGEAAKDEQLAAGSPLMGVLMTDGDRPDSWLRAGQALERLLLEAAREGVQASYLNQPLQAAELRPRVQDLLGRGFPQLILRLGFEDEPVPESPRRSVGEVLVRPEA